MRSALRTVLLGRRAVVGDTAAPTLLSSTINAAGTSLTLAFSEVVNIGAGGNGGWTITPSGGAATLAYASGSGTNSLVYTISRTVVTGETATVAYNQPGNGVEDTAGNDLANIASAGATNNSTSRTTFFGHCTSAGDVPVAWANTFDFSGAGTWFGSAGTQDFTCPGSGPQTINATGVYARTRAAPHANVRMAIYTYTIYDPTLVLVCEWNGKVLVNSTEQWWNLASFTGTAVLTGGQKYRIVVTTDSALFSYAYTTGVNQTRYLATDYTNGFPGTLAAGTGVSADFLIRVSITGDGTAAPAPTQEDYYVDTDSAVGSPDGSPSKPYTTLQSAVVARCNKPFTLPIVIHCKGATEDTTRLYDGALDQMVTSASNYLLIQTDPGHRASATWSTLKYRLTPAFASGAGAGTAVAMSHGYIYIDGLQIGISSVAGENASIELLYLSSANTGYIANCHIRGSNVTNVSNIMRGISSINGINVYNTIIDVRTGHAGNQAIKNHGNSNYYSSTILSGAGTGVDSSDGTIVAKNCFLQGSTASFLITTGSLTQTTVATNDALSDTVALRNIAVDTANFTNVTAGVENWDLPGTSALKGSGTDTSGNAVPFNFTTDIDGNTRSAPWDIGACKA